MQSQGVLSIERMCQVTGVSRAGFYRGWEQKAPDAAAMALRDAIQRTSVEHPRYGAAKVAELLRRNGWVVSVTRVQRVRREDNLLAVRRRKFVVTTDSDHEFLATCQLLRHGKWGHSAVRCFFVGQRGSSVSEWSRQEKRKRALLESNSPGISCRRLIPMSVPGRASVGLLPGLP